jgi:hypothetical protein
MPKAKKEVPVLRPAFNFFKAAKNEHTLASNCMAQVPRSKCPSLATPSSISH